MLKIVLFVVAVFVLLFLLRGVTGRTTPRREGRPAAPAPGTAPLLVCAQCGVHLPAGESLPGRGGVFCGEAHRAEYERRHDATT